MIDKLSDSGKLEGKIANLIETLLNMARNLATPYQDEAGSASFIIRSQTDHVRAIGARK
jgi:hypothetical protein